mmetsp:Transcript_14999/g.30500  ORF Transcript_14999/g.30500 Transcript_14999/m.30500 type:complete len:124 (+) Transcript_14999:77-448(+)
MASDIGKGVPGSLKKVVKAVKPYLPRATRVLMTATFFEDGLRAFIEHDGQVQFLNQEYRVPMIVAYMLLIVTTVISLAGAAMIVSKKRDKLASSILLGFLFYQVSVFIQQESGSGSESSGWLG